MTYFEKAAYHASEITNRLINPNNVISTEYCTAKIDDISELNPEHILIAFAVIEDAVGQEPRVFRKVYGADERGFMELTADCHALGLADASPLGVPELRARLIGTRVKLEVEHVRIDGSSYTDPRILCVVTDGDGTRITEADVIEAMYSAV